MERQHVDIGEGRRIAYWDLGDPIGRPVVALHGTPTSGQSFRGWSALAQRLGIRLLAPNRPGVGGSSFHGEYRVCDEAKRVVEFARALDLRNWAVLGMSGGGPYACSVAATLGSGTTLAIVVCGIGEITSWASVDEVDSTDTFMMTAPIDEVRAKARSISDMLQHDPKAAFDWLMASFDDETRSALVERAGSAEQFATYLMGEAFEDGPDAVVADYTALGQPWGVDPCDVTMPFQIFHGDADTSVGISHARALHERVGSGALTVWPKVGHFLGPDQIADVLASVGSSQARSG